MEKLVKDRAALLAGYDVPAGHGEPIRTTNPIESRFATIRHRTARTKNCVSRNTLLGLIFQLALTAQQSWRKLGGFMLLPAVVQGICFEDGLRVTDQTSSEVEEEQQIAAEIKLAIHRGAIISDGLESRPVNAGTAAVGPDQTPGVTEDVFPVGLVVERVETVGRFLLGLGIELPLERHDRSRGG